MLVGAGDEIQRLKNLVDKFAIQDKVIFCGIVPHKDVMDYYSVIDIFIYPRVDARVNHMVTPLKPLEAMSMGKAVLASDVGGMKELINHERTGLLFRRNDKNDFVKKCLELLGDNNLRVRLGENARDWIKSNRDWSQIVKGYTQVYERCLQARK